MIVSAILGTALVAALVLSIRLKTGQWAVPQIEDIKALKNDAVTVADKILGREPSPSKTIYLERDSVTLTAGADDATRGVSSVIGSGGRRVVRTRGFSGSNRRWRQIVGCVADQFRDFDVVVTDKKPASGDYLLAVVGGTAGELGIAGPHVGGLSPFAGEPVPRAVVFAFARQLRNNPRKVCETLAHEIAHAYGLDHSYRCSDMMSYRQCGRKRFVDRQVSCGERRRRPCRGGAETQNSYRHLMRVLGPREKRLTAKTAAAARAPAGG